MHSIEKYLKIFDLHTIDSVQQLYTYVASNGLTAIAWDSLQQAMSDGQIPQEQLPSKSQKIQWALATERIEQKYA